MEETGESGPWELLFINVVYFHLLLPFTGYNYYFLNIIFNNKIVVIGVESFF